MNIKCVELTIQFAKAFNHLDTRFIENLLTDNFHYISPCLSTNITNKEAYLDYFKAKIKTAKLSKWNIIASRGCYYKKPAFDLFMSDKNNKAKVKRIGALRVVINNGKIAQAIMHKIPSNKNIESFKGMPI